MPIFSCSRRGPFTQLGWAPAAAWGCLLATGAAVSELLPVAALILTISMLAAALTILAIRLGARERRIRARLAAMVAAPPPGLAADATSQETTLAADAA